MKTAPIRRCNKGGQAMNTFALIITIIGVCTLTKWFMQLVDKLEGKRV